MDLLLSEPAYPSLIQRERWGSRSKLFDLASDVLKVQGYLKLRFWCGPICDLQCPCLTFYLPILLHTYFFFPASLPLHCSSKIKDFFFIIINIIPMRDKKLPSVSLLILVKITFCKQTGEAIYKEQEKTVADQHSKAGIFYTV